MSLDMVESWTAIFTITTVLARLVYHKQIESEALHHLNGYIMGLYTQ